MAGSSRLADLPEPVRTEVLTALVDAGGNDVVCRRLTSKEISEALRVNTDLGRGQRQRLVLALQHLSIMAVFPRPPEYGLQSKVCGCNALTTTRETREVTTANACDARSATAQNPAPCGR